MKTRNIKKLCTLLIFGITVFAKTRVPANVGTVGYAYTPKHEPISIYSATPKHEPISIYRSAPKTEPISIYSSAPKTEPISIY